jgi:hypothetical protein
MPVALLWEEEAEGLEGKRREYQNFTNPRVFVYEGLLRAVRTKDCSLIAAMSLFFLPDTANLLDLRRRELSEKQF